MNNNFYNIEYNIDNDSDSSDFENLNASLDLSDASDSDIGDAIQTKKPRLLDIQASSDDESGTSNINNVEENWLEIDANEDIILPETIPFKSCENKFCVNTIKPIDYFKKIFTDELLLDIIDQTNLFAKNRLENKIFVSRSIWQNWKNVTYEEMSAFLGVILNMATISLNDVKDYFSKDFACVIPIFSKIFKKDRFLQIFHMLCLQQKSIDSNCKIQTPTALNFMTYLDLKFRENFIPDKEIYMSESVVHYNKRINFFAGNSDKFSKRRIKIYTLRDSKSGYVYSILPYYGSLTAETLVHPEHSIHARIVLQLYSNLLESIPYAEGYHLYVNGYAGVPLAEELLKKKCYLTGTVRYDDMLLPKKIKKPIFKTKNIIAYRSKKLNLLTLSWKDERIITMISSHDVASTRVTRNTDDIFKVNKPKVIVNYNKYMGDIDHYATMCCTLCKSSKCWRKLFYWGLGVCSLNSYILYKTQCRCRTVRCMSYLQFIRQLILSLVGDFRDGGTSHCGKPSIADNEERLDGRLHILQPNIQGKHNDCVVCSDRKVPKGRKTTIYSCETCMRKPFLHVGECFKKYHTLNIYR